MTDREFERIISFIVDEEIIRRLLNSAEQFDITTDCVAYNAKDKVQITNPKEFFN